MDMGSPNSKDEGARKTARLSGGSDGGRPSFGFADTGSSQKVLSFDESGERARVDLIEGHYADEKEGEKTQTQVFRSEQADGSVVTKTVRTTRTTTRSGAGDYVTTIEVQTTTETETKDGAKSTEVATETSTETVAGQVATFCDGESAAESGDDVQTQVFRSVEEDGRVVTKTVRTTRRTVITNGVATTTVEVHTTTETEDTDGAKSTSVSTETHTEIGGSSSTSETEEKAQAVDSEHGGRRSFTFGKKRKYHKQWHPHFVSYLDRQDKRVETLSTTDLLESARAFCRENFTEFRPELFNGESNEGSKECWEVMAQLAAHYPMVAVQLLAHDVGKKNLLIMDEITQGFDSENRLRKEVAVSMLGHSKTNAFQVFDDLLVLKNGEVVYHGAGGDVVEYFCDLEYQCTPGQRVGQFLLNLAAEQEDRYRILVPAGNKPDGSGSHFVKSFAVLMKFADDAVLVAGSSKSTPSRPTTPQYPMTDTSPINETFEATNMSVAAGSSPGESVKTEVFRSEEADGSIVTTTIRTTRRTVKSSTGALVTTIEVETTTETESTDGTTSTTVATETREETESEESSLTTTSASDATAVSVTEQAGSSPGESVKTEVFRSEEADGSIVTTTIRTTRRTVKSSTGALVTTIEVETTTETESTDGTTSTTVATETREETESEESSLTTTSASDATAVSVTEQAGSSPGESVKTEVFRSEEADGSIVTTTIRTTRRTVKSSTGALVTTIEVETTTETESTDGTTSTTVATETREETESEESSLTSPSGYLGVKRESSSKLTTKSRGTKSKRGGVSEKAQASSSVRGDGHGETEGAEKMVSVVLKSREATMAAHIGSGIAAATVIASKTEATGSKRDEKIAGGGSNVTARATEENEQVQTARAAAAWGEEVEHVQLASTETASTRKLVQVLAVNRGCSVRVAFDELACAAQASESSNAVKGVTGYAESGRMTAVIGAGRVGKTTFLGTLAGEENPTKGKIYYNGHEASALVRRRGTGYCWFGDEQTVWHGTTTVREALFLSACLRQNNEISETRKIETIQSWLELLGLTEIAEQPLELCSAVETRLVAIGVELAFSPSVLLVDEPTTGLDDKGAQRIVRVLQQVARTGRTIVCTLGDSVSSTELRVFDRLLLLSSSGETIFHGECRMLVQYLEALPGVKRLGSGKSIAAWALESVGEGSSISHTTTTTTTTKGGKARTSKKKKKYASGASMSTGSETINHEKETRFVQLFQRSEIKRALLTQMQRVGYLRPDSAEEHAPALVTAYKSGRLLTYATSWRTQVTLLMRRVLLSYWRSLSSFWASRSLMVSATAQWQRVSVMGVFLVALLWFLWLIVAARSSEYDTFDGVNQGASLIAWSTLTFGASVVLGAVARASRGNAWRENASWRREQAWQAYPAVAYHLCFSVVELVFVLVLAFVVTVLTFALFGFWSVAESGNFSLYWLTLAIFALGQVYLGQWLVRLMPSGSYAAVAGSAFNLLPLLTFVWSWRSSALGNLASWLGMVTPQRFALQVLQALVFGATPDSCAFDTVESGASGAESEIPCRELRLIPSDESSFSRQITVHSYAELEYGAERGSVAFRLVELAVFLLAFRFLVIVALQKRQTRA
ncbi:hypothetical protein PF005_g21386 [Phytophthora fragariae]|uniref:ABC transporter domain-containing protein n=1 Tax=Phytophthora fragariae TaxID=53985 RepID=A0A6A3XCQ8_9STRA|nr:hypothetical protein PF006_g20135 [Phytophthora fragariae]KAE9185114.1 hypothetical protein PF005_g21386 [Phytophthora fragariae]KAE9200266.1 hypothetical protein PF002_g21884 [Phytophthora fragariae]